MQTLYERHGAVAAVTRGDDSLVCAFGPELNHVVLSEPDLFANSADLPIRIPHGTALYRLTRFLVGMNGEDHRTLRRTMQPLFNRSQLERLGDDVVEATTRSLFRWTPGRSIDLATETAQLAINVAFRCLFGMDVDAEVASLAKMALGFIKGATSIENMMLPLPIPGGPYWRFLRNCERLEEHMRGLIAERRGRADQPTDVLSMLMQVQGVEGRPLSDERLVGLANELFIAGHETTARTLGWTLLLLERHPHVLEALTEELATVLGGRPPTLAQLDELVVLDGVVKESMRLMPSTPFLFFRALSERTTLGGYELTPGTKVVISPFMTHRMSELYEQPRRFVPERWRTLQRSTYEYLPFGAGPRTCLGASFARMSLRIMLSMILQHCRIELEPGASVSYQVRGIILSAKSGIPARIQPTTHRAGPVRSIGGNLGELIDFSHVS